jgi:hypothetical protein
MFVIYLMYKKIFAIIGAFISGGIGIGVLSAGKALADEVCITCITGTGSHGIIAAGIHSAPGISIASDLANCGSCALINRIANSLETPYSSSCEKITCKFSIKIR